jgi:predicted RecA/RadA family phage recombinase
MAKNFVQPGRMLSVSSTGVVTSGGVVARGAFVGVAQNDATTGETVTLALDGVFIIPKNAAVAMSLGDHAYWNATSSQVERVATTTRTYIGAVFEAAGTTAATVAVLLGYAPKQAFTA